MPDEYEYLTEQERLNLIEQRIRGLEADLFNYRLNELANVSGQPGAYAQTIQLHEDALERLRDYRDEVRRNPDAPVPEPVAEPVLAP